MKQAIRKAVAAPVTRAPADRRKPDGVVVAIVAVTGVEDEVNDIIQPGIFPAALARRRPKVVFHHDFKDFVGRVLHAEEWMPGDRRLPKTQPNGRPWPKEAGALVATMQFNMATARGRDVYEWARFYAESGEAAWSIGYTVPPGFSAKRGTTRIIYGIDLYEVSLVLHGANPLTMALEVKAAASAVASARAFERKTFFTPAVQTKGDVSPIGTPGDRENWVDQVGGLPLYIREIAHALIRNGHTESRAIAMAVASVKRWASGGDDVNEDTRVKAAAALAEWEAKKAAAHADNFEGKAANPLVAAGLAVRAADTGRVLMLQRALVDGDDAAGKWEFPGGHIEGTEGPLLAAQREWAEETGAQLPPGRVVDQWDSPNGVYRGYVYQVPDETCVAINADHEDRRVLNPDDPDGDQVEVVAWWNPRELPNNPALRSEVHDTPWHMFTAVERKSAAQIVREAKSTQPAPMETKMTKQPAGSYEERRRLLTDALNDTYRPMTGGRPSGYVSIDATYDDHVVASIWPDGHGDPETFVVSYTVAGDAVTLGEKAPATLELVVTGDGPATPAADLLVAPATEQIAAATEALAAAPMERKDLGALRSPLLALLDTLAEKGMDVPGLVFGEEEDPDLLDADLEADLDVEADEEDGDGAPPPHETKGGWARRAAADIPVEDGAPVDVDEDMDDEDDEEPDVAERPLTPADVQSDLEELRAMVA